MYAIMICGQQSNIVHLFSGSGKLGTITLSVLYALTCGARLGRKSYSGFYVNGYKLYTKDHSHGHRIANWDVTILGDKNVEDYMDFYDWIVEIIVL